MNHENPTTAPTLPLDPNPRPSLFQILIILMIPLFFTIGGAFLLINAWPRVVEGLSARSWPHASGEVVETQMFEVDQGGWGPGTKRWYEVRVKYAFDVGGTTVTAERTTLRRNLWQLLEARALTESYPTGKAVTVYYNPADPSRALLDRSIGGLTWTMEIGGIPVTLLGLVMLVGWTRGVRRSR